MRSVAQNEARKRRASERPRVGCSAELARPCSCLLLFSRNSTIRTIGCLVGFAPHVIRLRALRRPTCPLSQPDAVAWRARVPPPAVSRVRALAGAARTKQDSTYAGPPSRPKRADARIRLFACLVGPTFFR
jgi:hypothetical protein